MVPIWLRESNYYKKFLKNETIIDYSIQELEHNNILCYKVIVESEHASLSDLKEVIYFRQSDYLPISYMCTFNIGILPYEYGYDMTYYTINQGIDKDIFRINPDEVIPTEDNEPKNQVKNELIETGTIAPDFSTELNNNNIIQLSDLKDKIVILDFWYLGCPPCHQAMPELIDIQNQFEANDVIVIGINPYDRVGLINDLFENKEVNYFSSFLTQDIAELYGVQSYPTTIILDKEYKVSKVLVGWNKNFKSDIINTLESLIKR